jgi:hypothetical protein
MGACIAAALPVRSMADKSMPFAATGCRLYDALFPRPYCLSHCRSVDNEGLVHSVQESA